MVEVLAVVAVVIILAAVLWAWRRASAAAVPGPRRDAWAGGSEPHGARVVLDLEGVDPDLPSVQRLVREAAQRVLAKDPDLDEVQVVARDGQVLGRERRPDPLPPAPAIPDALHEPHARPRRGPSPVPRDEVTHPQHVPDPGDRVRATPLADRLDLPPDVRRRVREPDDGAGIVAATLEAAGRPVTRDGDLVRSGDVAIVVVDVHGDADRALTHGFLRIQATDAPRGIVIRLGYVDPSLVRRREAMAAHVRHVGPDALQRMADAVAAGADPVAFAAGPAVLV
jgi:hypothetical protein